MTTEQQVVDRLGDERTSAAQKIAEGAVIKSLYRSNKPMSAIKLACELEIDTVLIRRECDRLLKEGLITPTFKEEYRWLGMTKADIFLLQDTWRANRWSESGLKEFLFSYHSIPDFLGLIATPQDRLEDIIKNLKDPAIVGDMCGFSS